MVVLVKMLSLRSLSTCPRRMMSKKMTQKDFEKHTELQKVRDTELLSKEIFMDTKQKNKETFTGALELFKNGDIRRRGTVGQVDHQLFRFFSIIKTTAI